MKKYCTYCGCKTSSGTNNATETFWKENFSKVATGIVSSLKNKVKPIIKSIEHFINLDNPRKAAAETLKLKEFLGYTLEKSRPYLNKYVSEELPFNIKQEINHNYWKFLPEHIYEEILASLRHPEFKRPPNYRFVKARIEEIYEGWDNIEKETKEFHRVMQLPRK
jgi:hypothetical protein